MVGIKEGRQDQLYETVRESGSEFAVFAARDSYLLSSLAVGAVGVVSFAAKIAPKTVCRVLDEYAKGNLAGARRAQESVGVLVECLVSRSYPVLIKEMLRARGLPAGPSRRVRTELTTSERDVVKELSASID